MLIWTLAIGLLVVVGALGLLQGAVRTVTALLGLFLGAVLALPLGRVLEPIMGKIGIVHPVWSKVWPPIIVLLFFYFVFLGISFVIHRKFYLHYKYGGDDVARIRWERMNKNLGLCVGLAMACVWLVILSVGIYVAGYVTVQVSSEESNSPWIGYLNSARKDLHSTGLDRLAAKFDPMPAKYYEAADVLGVIYNNPLVKSRLTQYPPFLLMGDNPEFAEMTSDQEYLNLLFTKGDVFDIIQHPKTQSVLNNSAIMDKLMSQDLADLQEFLKTGISPKFAEETILGRWYIDPYATLIAERKKRPDITASEMGRLKKQILEELNTVEFVATPEKQVKLLLGSSATPAESAPAPDENADPDAQSSDFGERLADRYGLPPGSGTNPRFQGGGQRAPAPRAPAPKPKPLQFLTGSSEGTWNRESSNYTLEIQDPSRGSQKAKAIATVDTLTIELPAATLIFVRPI
jgi:hypothetical protein